MEKKIRIRKIDVLALMETLNELYHKGIDYIDIHGIHEDGQDTIGIVFNKGYMNEEFADNFEHLIEDQVPSKIEVKLSDEDLDQLI